MRPEAFGERIASRDPDLQSAEIPIRIALMTCCNALGRAEIGRFGQGLRRKGKLASTTSSATMPSGGTIKRHVRERLGVT
ncbi:transposase, IS4 family protein [Rhodovulum sulfidophilum]|uniref:Transposase, IS4 family protein n=1 Tax=Rhodovulum sulfidophilum TaxID=35806 RepID=A0A0D6AYE5_RHOSU|nr:transposase, IS4 family protein [Rhodovulum sulfidophilum]